MAIVNFAIHRTLEQRVVKVIKQKVFASKAELFRFAVQHYLNELEGASLDSDPEISTLTEGIATELRRIVRSKKIPSVRQQMRHLSSV